MDQPFYDELLYVCKVCRVDTTGINSISKLTNLIKTDKKINWHTLSASKTIILSDKFYIKFKKNIKWDSACKYQKLTEPVLYKVHPLIDRLDFHCLSSYQVLSEQFIRDFKDKLNWFSISYNQNLSSEFISEFENKIDFNAYSNNKYLDINIVKKYWDRFKDKNDLLINPNLPDNIKKLIKIYQ